MKKQQEIITHNVKLLTGCVIDGKKVEAGKTVTVRNNLAKSLVAMGRGEIVASSKE